MWLVYWFELGTLLSSVNVGLGCSVALPWFLFGTEENLDWLTECDLTCLWLSVFWFVNLCTLALLTCLLNFISIVFGCFKSFLTDELFLGFVFLGDPSGLGGRALLGLVCCGSGGMCNWEVFSSFSFKPCTCFFSLSISSVCRSSSALSFCKFRITGLVNFSFSGCHQFLSYRTEGSDWWRGRGNSLALKQSSYQILASYEA